MNCNHKHPRCAGITQSWQEHWIPQGTALTAVLCSKMCTITCYSHKVAMAAAVVGKSCPCTTAVFGLHHSKASGKDPQCPAGGKQVCSGTGRGSPGQWGCVALVILGALEILYGIMALAPVSQDAAAGTAVLEQGIAAFTFGIAAPPKKTRGHAENWRQIFWIFWVPDLRSNPVG